MYDDGYRSWSYSYADVAAAARALPRGFAPRASARGRRSRSGRRIAPEWIIALWGCLLEGVVLVPIDYRASADFLLRVADIVDARAVLVGDAVDREAIGADASDLACVGVEGPARSAARRRRTSA